MGEGVWNEGGVWRWRDCMVIIKMKTFWHAHSHTHMHTTLCGTSYM